MAKRRANGEGNLRKRKDGRWEGRYTAGHDPETGKAIYKNVLGRTQAEAKAKLKTAIEETKVLDVTKVGKYTVGAWMDEWFENYTKVKVRPSSHQTYRGYIDNHIKPNIGKIQLEKLTSLELQKLYKKLLTSGRIDRIESKHQAKGLSPKTVRNIHQIITSAMKLAKEQKIIASDPTEGCALPKLEHREMKTLPIEQLTSFLREARDSGVFEMYYVELATGLRRGELLGLKWEDIDFEHGNLRVKRQVARIDGEVVEAPLKTKNAYRTLPLADDTIQVLKSAEKESEQQSLGIPLAYRRPDLAGQCAPHASSGAETSRAAQDPVSRSPSHLRHPGPSERSGYQDGIRDAGALLGRLHTGHLRPRHDSGPEGGGESHGKSSGKCPLTPGKRQKARRWKHRLRADFLTRLGHGLGQLQILQNRIISLETLWGEK